MKNSIHISPFGFCNYCKVSQKCCRMLKPNGALGAPFLTKGDKRRIEDHLGQNARYFTQVEFDRESSERLTCIKTRPEGGCIFYKDHRCQIYSVRPFDCRIFPLDIFKMGRCFYWIIYTTFCRETLNYNVLRDYGENLLQDYKVDIEEFASRMDVSPPSLQFKILGKVKQQVGKQNYACRLR